MITVIIDLTNNCIKGYFFHIAHHHHSVIAAFVTFLSYCLLTFKYIVVSQSSYQSSQLKFPCEKSTLNEFEKCFYFPDIVFFIVSEFLTLITFQNRNLTYLTYCHFSQCLQYLFWHGSYLSGCPGSKIDLVHSSVIEKPTPLLFDGFWPLY